MTAILVPGQTIALPITVSEVMEHCGLNPNDSPSQIERWIQAATQYVENETGRALVESEWDQYFSCWPSRDYFQLEKGNLYSITHLKYTDSAGVVTTWASANYICDQVKDRLHLAYQISWPSVILQPVNGIVIRFKAGWANVDAVPAAIKQAILLTVGALNENRESVILGNTASSVSSPLFLNRAQVSAVDALIEQYKLYR